MNDERLRQLYLRGLEARAARGGGGVECAVDPDDLLALARGELPEEQRLELLDVVMSSERCRRELDLVRAVVAAERAALASEVAAPSPSPPLPEPEAPGDAAPGRPALRVVQGGAPRDARVARPWWRRAAVPTAVAATLVLAIGLGQSLQDRPSGEEVTRGAPADGGLAQSETVTETGLRLSWRPLAGATRYAVEVVDAEGNAVYETTTPDTAVTLPTAVTLRPDVEYRWIVRASDDAGSLRGSAFTRLEARPAPR